MSKHWKEPYSKERAEAAGIHDYEGAVVVGAEDARWIYYVDVCSFTFTFFSLKMLREYLEYYSQKTLPSGRRHNSSKYSTGPAASVGDGQSRFERLPARLRKSGKRERVVKALKKALGDFEDA